MGVPQSPNHPHLYPQALQLKLYQAFIFSIPVLFSIILFLLFYLFYLKRRASNTISSTPLPRPRRPRQTTTYVSSTCQLDFKLEIKGELPIVLFDEELKKRDSQCCVCLGEFVVKEELLQVPSCKHVFHVDCIHLWLHTNTTCPLCRCSVLSTPAKLRAADHPNPPAGQSQRTHDQASTSDTIEGHLMSSSETSIAPSIDLLTNDPGSVVIDVQRLHNDQAN